MPLYKIFDTQIEAPNEDQAVLAIARSDIALQSTRKKLHTEWQKSHAYSMSFQSFLDATQVQVGSNSYYPLRNFEILLEEVKPIS